MAWQSRRAAGSGNSEFQNPIFRKSSLQNAEKGGGGAPNPPKFWKKPTIFGDPGKSTQIKANQAKSSLSNGGNTAYPASPAKEKERMC